MKKYFLISLFCLLCILSGCSMNDSTTNLVEVQKSDLLEFSENCDLELAKEQGCVILQNNYIVENKEIFNQFLGDSDEVDKASIRLVYSFKYLGADDLFVCDLVYNGKYQISYVEDGEIKSEIYDYLNIKDFQKISEDSKITVNYFLCNDKDTDLVTLLTAGMGDYYLICNEDKEI